MGIPFSEMHCDGFFHSLYPMGTHLLSWENLYFKKIMLISTLNKSLGVRSFESKDPSVPSYASTYFQNLLLLKHYHALITLWSMYVQAYVIGP
jgi:hypothetical protein